MERAITWYDVLGVLPGAEPEKVRQRYATRTGLLRSELISGAPSNVLAVVRRAQAFLDTAWEVLGDPATRSRYDALAGVRRGGGGLTASGAFGGGARARSGRGSRDPAVAVAPGADALGELLALGGYAGPGGRAARRVPVPDIRGLFYDVCMDLVGQLGLRVRSVQLTPHPMPVDGLVVDQVPRAPGKLGRGETLTAHVWHPPVRFRGPAR
jgi:hypothetical protein